MSEIKKERKKERTKKKKKNLPPEILSKPQENFYDVSSLCYLLNLADEIFY